MSIKIIANSDTETYNFDTVWFVSFIVRASFISNNIFCYVKLTQYQFNLLGSNVGQTLQKAKRRVEDRFNKFVLKKGKKKDGSLEESSGGCK